MKYPTAKQLDRMDTGFKLVGVDLCTHHTEASRYRYQLDAWNEAPGPILDHQGECPAAPGDGLCVALSVPAAQSGGQRLGSSVMLLVGYLPDDILGTDGYKVRVRRLYVHPDPVDPVQLVLWAIAADNLGGADLGGANLRDANLRGANLRGANLRGANLRGANLRGANLRGADLGGADLRDADLGDADLGDADLRDAYLRDAYLGGANLRDANLGDADLRDADLRGANLGDADLGDADLRDAYLGDADLRGANLRGANLRGANLRGANLRGATGNEWTTLPAGYRVNDSGLIVQDGAS